MRALIPTLLFALALAIPSFVFAEVRPYDGTFDPRVKTVDYNADNVVKVIGHYGFSTNIQFAEGETVQSIALGDTLAWEVAPRGNQLFVKPREDNATTNMTVVTDKRSYQFWLDAAKAANKGRGAEMYFRVKFNYPMEAAKLARVEEDKRRAESALKIAPQPRNWNYWTCGTPRLRPTEVYDDGRFTYLRFPNAQEIPAAYYRDSDGQERLANGTMRGDQLVLQLVADKLLLRRGKSVACLENRAFNPYGVSTPTGTTSPVVERAVKDGAQPPAPQLPILPKVKESREDDEDSGSGMPVLPFPMPQPMPQPTGVQPSPEGAP